VQKKSMDMREIEVITDTEADEILNSYLEK
jgi:hypothetical protein